MWRITTRRFIGPAFSGEGARLFGGPRWNRPGQSVVYTAESSSLALLEMLVQDDPLRVHYVLIPAYLPPGVSIEFMEAGALPQGWRRRVHQFRPVKKSVVAHLRNVTFAGFTVVFLGASCIKNAHLYETSNSHTIVVQ